MFVTETPTLFGPEAALVGVLTQPARNGPAAVAFLMFNAGVLSRIGPHRMNVKLARALAKAGETSLRFDLSGRGDSRSSIAEGDSQAQAPQDIRLGMDHLEKNHGIQRFALIGFCSGAVNAFNAALLDDRVAGVLMFDGHWYRTRWTVPVRHWKRFRVISWPDVAAAVWRRLTGRLAAPATPLTSKAFAAESLSANPTRAEFVRSVQVLVDRRVATCFIYSGSVIDCYSYANQFRDAFGHEAFFDRVRCDFRPDIDHTFISIEAQQSMIDLVLGWAGQVHGACEAAA